MAFPLNQVRGLMVAVGEIERPEFSGLAPYWTQHADSWKVAPSLAALGDGEGEENQIPRVVLLLSSRLDQFEPREIVELRRQIPLAQIFHLEGAWCAGGGRTAQSPLGVPRMAWHQWPYRLTRALQLPTPRPIPVTSTELERILAQCPPAIGVEAAPKPANVLISAPRLDDFEPLATCCDELGYEPIWYERTAENLPQTEIALWVGTSLHGTSGRDPTDFAQRVGSANIVWCLESVQVHDFSQIHASERSSILALPGLVEDLRFAFSYAVPPAVCDQVPSIPR